MTVGLAGPLPAGGSLNEEAIRNAIKAAWPRRLRNPRVLLQGDFWQSTPAAAWGRHAR